MKRSDSHLSNFKESPFYQELWTAFRRFETAVNDREYQLSMAERSADRWLLLSLQHSISELERFLEFVKLTDDSDTE